MRLFTAINFNENIASELKHFQSELKKAGVRGRFVPLENLHMTLAFIGEYNDPDAVIDAMEEALFEPLEISLSGVGNFGDLFWVGFEENEELKAFVKRLRHALSEHEIPFDRKKFSPHITIIRKAELPNRKALESIQMPAGKMKVTGFSLMRSDRGKNGMIYTEIGRIE